MRKPGSMQDIAGGETCLALLDVNGIQGIMMDTKLSKETLKGIFGAVPMIWGKDGRLDDAAMRHDIAWLARSGIQGLYIGGSTSEFYCFELDDFKSLVDLFLEASDGVEIYRQVGCPWINGAGVLERVRHAAKAGADGIQFTYPSWEKMRFAECRDMLLDIAEAADGLPLIHYNIPKGGRVHTAEEYNLLAESVPSLIGTKLVSGNSVDEATMIREAPHLNHFVGEYTFLSGMAMGARGMYSGYYALNPRLMVKWYESCLNEDWNEAMEIHRAVMRCKTGFTIHLNREGWSSTAKDKIMAVLNPDLKCTYRGQYPYQVVPDGVARAKEFIKRECPKLLEGMSL